MLNIFKKVFSPIVALGIVFLCTACAEGNENTNYSREMSDAPIAQGQSGESDATAKEVPNDYMGIYEAEPQCFSEEDINRFLSCCKDGVASSQKDTGDTSVRYSGTTSRGKQFLYLEGTGYHPHKVFQYIDHERYTTYSAYPIYSGEELYETNAQYSVGWMFTEPKDFPFATAKDAEESVRGALAALGVPDITLLRTLYIDHNTMEAAGKRLATDPAYAPIGEPQENNGYPIRDDWSEADDAYMFSFGISVESTTLSTRFEIRDTASYVGSQIIVWYSANGIDYLSVDMPWKVGAVVQGPEKIISPEEALQVVKNRVGGILTYQNLSYTEPFLEYQYKQAKEKWLLYPVWTVKVSYQVMESSETYYSFISVEALTGEEI